MAVAEEEKDGGKEKEGVQRPEVTQKEAPREESDLLLVGDDAGSEYQHQHDSQGDVFCGPGRRRHGMDRGRIKGEPHGDEKDEKREHCGRASPLKEMRDRVMGVREDSG